MDISTEQRDEIMHGMSKDEVANFKLSLVAKNSESLAKLESTLQSAFDAATDKKEQVVLKQKLTYVHQMQGHNKVTEQKRDAYSKK